MSDKEIRHPDVWKISDERYENALNYITVELSLKVLGCIEEGRVDLIKEFVDERIRQYMEEILSDQKKWIQIICYVSGMAFAFAVKGGLPCEKASAITTKYINEASLVTCPKELVQLQIDMYVHFAKEVHYYKKIKTGHFAVDTAINYIEDHIDAKIKVNDIAQACAYSISSLQHLFSQYMHMTLTDYIRKKKIEKACFLLAYTDLSCTKISEKLSYSSQSYFINQFYKEMNMNPLQYRKEHYVHSIQKA